MPRARAKSPGSDVLVAVPPVQYTGIPAPLLTINGKNVASSYGKESSTQSWWTRRADDTLWEGQRGWKKNVMMGGEHTALLTRPPDEKVPTFHARDGVCKGTRDTLDVDPASRIIIIHPGARWVRIGRASDASPVTVPNVVARRCSPPRKGGFYCDMEPPHDPNSAELYAAKLEAIRSDLRVRMRALRLRGTGNGSSQAAAYNMEVQPELLGANQEQRWTRTRVSDGDTFVGEQALWIADPAQENLMVRWPLLRGALNIAAFSGYTSRSEILADVEAVWLYALRTELGIDELDLKDYSAVLIVPDLYDHTYLREMVDLLFRSLSFKQISLQQESLSACFGAGLATACVIDIGASKMSVSCIEEGWVLPETRIQLAFGGDDITIALTEMLRRQALPYKDADLNKAWDWQVMEQFKESMIVLSEGDVGLNIYKLYAKRPGSPLRSWSVRTYDECILAPMALFAPRIVDFEHKFRPGKLFLGDRTEVDDVLDLGGSAVTEAMKGSTAHLLGHTTITVSSLGTLRQPGESAPENVITSVPLVSSAPTTPLPHTTAFPSGAPPASLQPNPFEEGEPEIDVALEASKMPLHVAVAESLFACGSEERAKRMLGAIMVVGGGGLIHNVGYAVTSRIQPLLTARWPTIGEGVAVPPPLEIDSRELAWKGVSLLTRLDVTSESWVRSSDWEALGSKAIKDRTLFML